MEKEHLEVILESIDSKFNLVLEGYAALDEKFTRKIDALAERTEERFDLVDFKIDTLNGKINGAAADLKVTESRLSQKIYAVEEKLTKKIDAVDEKLTGVAQDLKAHRADTEAHHGIYRVKEG